VEGNQVDKECGDETKVGFNGLSDVMALLSWIEVGLTSEAM
jgi:hypothetical protein